MKRGSLSIAQSGWRLIIAAMVALVLVSSAVVPLTDTALAQGPNPIRSSLPDDQVLRDEAFNVSVTFNASADGFNAIGLGDNVPAGWAIQVNTGWCTPNADEAVISANQAQYAWYGPYDSGQAFIAIYQVTVPGNASAGIHLFSGQLEYYENGLGPYFEDIGGDSDVTVAVPPTPTPTIIPTPPPTAVPTVSQWGMIGMITMFAAVLIWSIRKRWIISANKSQ